MIDQESAKDNVLTLMTNSPFQKFSNSSSNSLNHFDMSIFHVLSNYDFVKKQVALDIFRNLNDQNLEGINSKDALGWTPLMVAC